MKELIDFIEMEMKGMSPTTRQRFRNWIDEIKTAFPEVDADAPKRLKRQSKNNSSGIIGVRRKNVVSGYGNKNFNRYWIATWSVKDKCYQKSYSIEKLGDKEAFRRACYARFRNCGELMVYSFGDAPCKPSVPYKMVKKNA